jgi:hypothetical protein
MLASRELMEIKARVAFDDGVLDRLSLVGTLVVAETLAPDEGLLKGTVRVQIDAVEERDAKDSADPDAAVKDQIAKAKAEEEQNWSEVSYLLTIPIGYAVAIHRDGEEPSALYKVVAKGRESEAQTSQCIAWVSKDSIVPNDPTLAIRVYQSVKTGRAHVRWIHRSRDGRKPTGLGEDVHPRDR